MDLGRIEADAAAALTAEARAYVERGAGAGDTLAANLEGWRRLQLRPHVLHDVSTITTATTVLGVPVAAPVLVAPTAQHGLVTADAECATAQAAAAADTILVMSMASSRPWEEIASAVPNAHRWAQLYVLRDRGATRAMCERAAACGCGAIVVSVDGAVVPYGEARRAADGIALDAGVSALVDAFDAAVTFDDLAPLREWSGLPLVVKGVLRGDDARRCVESGAAAIYVSNHGGRLVDGCIDTATALTDIVDTVAGDTEVYVDGGIRNGTDVVRALALGARAVLLGRPVLWGLAIGGAAGAAAVLDAFTTDVRRTMAFCGARSVAELDRDLSSAGEVRRRAVQVDRL